MRVGRRARRQTVALAVVGGLAIAAAVVAVFQLGGSATGSRAGGELAQMSNGGQAIDPGKGQRLELENVGAVAASRLATRVGRAFYRLMQADGGICYAVDVVGGDHLGNTSCPGPEAAFPTPSNPVLDLSIFESTTHVPGDVHIVSAQGFAADGVRTIALLDEHDRVVARAPVTANVYAVDVPAGRSASAVVAYDARHAQVYRVP